MQRKLHIGFWFVAAAVIGITLAWMLYYNWYLLDVQTTEVRFTVTEDSAVGFDIDKTLLAFGKVPQGGGAERKATLEAKVPANVRIISNLPWVNANMTQFQLEPGVPREIAFFLEVPQNATPGNYTGQVKIIYTRRFGEFI